MSDPLDGFYAVLDGYISRAVAPLREVIEAQKLEIAALKARPDGLDRIAALEARDPVVVRGIDGKDGAKGLDGTRGEKGEPGQPGKDGRDGVDGKSVDIAEVAAMVKEQVALAVAAIPVPKDGRDGVDGQRGEPGANGKDGRDGVDGKSVDIGDVEYLVKERVDEAVALLPKPKDGRDGIDGKDGSDGLNGKDGRDGIDGKDGASILSAVIDADGELVLTSSDGTTRKAGVVRGKDGRDGERGEKGADGVNGRDAASLDLLPRIEDHKSYPAGTWAVHAGGSWFANKATEPLNGRNPQDAGWTCTANGEASFSIDLDDDGRTVVAKRKTSTGLVLEKRYTVPVVLDRGVFVASKQYAKGDGVTRSGSFYIAKCNNPKGLPGASDDWRLAVKAGKDGK